MVVLFDVSFMGWFNNVRRVKSCYVFVSDCSRTCAAAGKYQDLCVIRFFQVSSTSTRFDI